MESEKDRVKLNVGGKKFETTITTFAGAGRNSFFGAIIDENWNLHSDGAITEHFIDRNPDYFGVLLDLLRTGELYIPQNKESFCGLRFPKLAFHEGQLNNSISVYCGSDWLPTSQLRKSTPPHDGPIRDCSIGGNRLFALHYLQNVWETPRPPII